MRSRGTAYAKRSNHAPDRSADASGGPHGSALAPPPRELISRETLISNRRGGATRQGGRGGGLPPEYPKGVAAINSARQRTIV